MPETRLNPDDKNGMLMRSGHNLGESEAMSVRFNPNMMITARQLKDWNQADLAEETNKTQAYISKVERLVLPPSDDFVHTLAEKTDFPRSFFFQPGHMGGLPVSVHPMYRKQTTKAKVLDRVNAEMSLRIFHARVLQTESSELARKFAGVQEQIGTSMKNPKSAAQALRKYYGQPSGPVKNLTKLAEDTGILVYHCDFGDDTDDMVDGVSMHIPALPPTIFLNKNRPADRLRFSLAHEIGHILLHRIPTYTMEEEANDFAGELLLPEADMQSLFTTPVNLTRLAALKPEWQVSIQALLYRAGKLNAINDNAKRTLWNEIHRMGWKKHEPAFLDFAPERTSLMEQILRNAGDGAAEKLHTHSHKLKEMYQIAA